MSALFSAMPSMQLMDQLMEAINDTDCGDLVFPLCYENHVEFIGYMFIDMPLNLLGIITNALTLLVMHNRAFRGRGSMAFILLRAMAVGDLLACASIFPIGFCRCFPPAEQDWVTYMRQFYDIYIYLPFANWFGTMSIWMTMIVSIERYIQIGFPIVARRICNGRRGRYIVLISYTLAFGFNMPYFFLKQIGDPPPPVYTEWGKSPGADVYFWFRMVFARVIPIMVILITNSFLLYAIWSMDKRHPSASQGNNNNSHHDPDDAKTRARNQLQRRATLMVISISIVLLVCHALEPFAHNAIFGSLFGECNIYGRGHRIFIIFINSMETFTYATNFFFYCIFNKQFATVLGLMCCARCKRNKVQIMEEKTNSFTMDS